MVFSEYRALGPLRTGTAVDRSSGGLRIITSSPEPLGTTIQIELRASADSSSVLLLEGRIVHLTPMDKGQCAMGIRLVQPTLRSGTPPSARERRVLPARTPAMAAATASAEGRRGVPAVAGAAAATEDEAVTFRRIEDGGRAGSWAALLAILVLFVILLLLIMEAMRDEERRASAGIFDGVSLEGILAKILPREESASARSSGPARSAKKAEPVRAAPEFVSAVGGRVLRSGPSEGVVPAVGAPALLGEVSNAMYTGGMPAELRRAAPLSADGFAAMLEYAERAAARGEAGLARALVRRAMARAGTIPAAWRALAGEYQRELSADGEIGAARLLSREVSLDVAAAATAPTPLRIEVDTGDHLLRVWRGNEKLAEFPVGLGRENATPRGEFRIGTKARQPAWYAEGRVVPGGTPENPIGGQWLGLAQDGARTGYGIHPTSQAASIGADQSLGCVRMRPEDAETLYRLVPVGAAVTIHS